MHPTMLQFTMAFYQTTDNGKMTIRQHQNLFLFARRYDNKLAVMRYSVKADGRVVPRGDRYISYEIKSGGRG